jgi:hypothetical protein
MTFALSWLNLCFWATPFPSLLECVGRPFRSELHLLTRKSELSDNRAGRVRQAGVISVKILSHLLAWPIFPYGCNLRARARPVRGSPSRRVM